MPTLQVRDLPEEIYARLKRQAEREHRSLAQQATVILERGLGQPETNKNRRQAILTEVGDNPLRLNKGTPTPEELLAEDRQR